MATITNLKGIPIKSQKNHKFSWPHLWETGSDARPPKGQNQ